MKTVNVTELKTHLSQYLRMVGKGERVLVMDRKEPVAQLIPVASKELSWRERLALEGRLRLGTQERGRLRIKRLRGRVSNIQESLQAIREDPSEVRRR